MDDAQKNAPTHRVNVPRRPTMVLQHTLPERPLVAVKPIAPVVTATVTAKELKQPRSRSVLREFDSSRSRPNQT